MKVMKKYLDWKGWLEGFYLSWIKTVTDTLLALVASNGAQALGVPHIGLNWQQAGGLCGTLTIVQIIRYLNAKPMPDSITTEETINTQFTTTTTKTTVTDKEQP